MFLPELNPDDKMINQLIDESESGSLNWLKDVDSGDIYYWLADSNWITHSVMADFLQLDNVEHGMVSKSGSGDIIQQQQLTT